MSTERNKIIPFARKIGRHLCQYPKENYFIANFKTMRSQEADQKETIPEVKVQRFFTLFRKLYNSVISRKLKKLL